MSDREEEFEDDPELGEEEQLPVEGEEEMEEDEDGKEKEAGEEEEEEEIPENPLTEEMAAESLSLLSPTGEGLSHAYIRLDVHEKEVTDVSILNRFIHLRYVDLSRNLLKDLSALSPLTHLLSLKADHNLLPSARLDTLPYLQVASFSRNRIRSTEGLNHPLLENLSLSFNEISSVSGFDPDILGRLSTLELRANKLETTAGLNIPTLKNLFLGGNVVRRLEGLEGLVNLATLHLRDNQLEVLDGFSESMKALAYVNLRRNNISNMAELKKLAVLPALKAVVLLENPLSEDDEYRLEVLMALPAVNRLDKDEYIADDRLEAAELSKQREAQKAEEEAAESAVAASPEE